MSHPLLDELRRLEDICDDGDFISTYQPVITYLLAAAAECEAWRERNQITDPRDDADHDQDRRASMSEKPSTQTQRFIELSKRPAINDSAAMQAVYESEMLELSKRLDSHAAIVAELRRGQDDLAAIVREHVAKTADKPLRAASGEEWPKWYEAATGDVFRVDKGFWFNPDTKAFVPQSPFEVGWMRPLTLAQAVGIHAAIAEKYPLPSPPPEYPPDVVKVWEFRFEQWRLYEDGKLEVFTKTADGWKSCGTAGRRVTELEDDPSCVLIYTRPTAEGRQEEPGPAPYDTERARWQDAIHVVLVEAMERVPRDHRRTIDGAGCESGDPLDVTLSEVRQALAAYDDWAHSVTADRDSWKARAEVLAKAASEAFDLLQKAAESTDSVQASRNRTWAGSVLFEAIQGACP